MGLPLTGAGLKHRSGTEVSAVIELFPGSTKLLFVDLVKRSLAIYSAIEPVIGLHIVRRPSNGCLH